MTTNLNDSTQEIPLTRVSAPYALTGRDIIQTNHVVIDLTGINSGFQPDEDEVGNHENAENTATITDEPAPSNPFDEDEVDEAQAAENLRIVSDALRDHFINDAKGFIVDSDYLPCCPSMSVDPILLGSGDSAVHLNRWKMETSTSWGCFCCCTPDSWHENKITLQRGSVPVLHFVYQQHLWCQCGKKNHVVNIHIPELDKRIGWIRYGDSVEEGAIIADCISKSVFILTKIKNHPSKGNGMVYVSHIVKILNHLGIPAAIGQATKGVQVNGSENWNTFEMHYSPESPLTLPLSAPAKGVTLAALMMWILTYKDKRCRLGCVLYMVIIFGAIGLGFLYAAISG